MYKFVLLSFFFLVLFLWQIDTYLLNCTMTRHHAESNINTLMIRNLLIDSGVRQWSHSLMIPLKCLWVESNNRTRGQLNETWLGFVFILTSLFLHAWCGCCSIVCWGGRGRARLKMDVRSQGGWKNVGRRWTRGLGGLEN